MYLWQFEMSNQLPGNFGIPCEDIGMGMSSRNENCYESWFQAFPSMENGGFQDIFAVLATTGTTEAGSSSRLDLSCEHDDKGQSSGSTVRKRDEVTDKEIPEEVLKREQIDRPKRRRRAEMHNMPERKRRDKIKERMQTLQELIPNCTKSGKASILDEAINYVKALKLQLQKVSAGLGGGIVFQAPCMPPGGIQTPQQGSQFSPSVGMFCSSGSPSAMMSVPWGAGCSLRSSLSGRGPGLPLMYIPGAHAVPQLQIPYLPSQQLPTSINASVHLSTLPPTERPQIFRQDSLLDSISQAKGILVFKQYVAHLLQVR